MLLRLSILDNFFPVGNFNELEIESKQQCFLHNSITASDLFSGHGYSGNDGFSGTKPLDDAILFTNSGITALVELFLGKF